MVAFQQHLTHILDQHWSLYHFNKTFDLFYAGQIPHGAVFVKQGIVEMIYRGKVKKILEPQTIYFLKELLQEQPIKSSIRVQGPTALYLLDKPAVYQRLEQFKSL